MLHQFQSCSNLVNLYQFLLRVYNKKTMAHMKAVTARCGDGLQRANDDTAAQHNGI